MEDFMRVNIVDISDFELLIQDWAVERNIYAESNPIAQAEKTREVLNELIKGITNGDREDIKDAVGDMMVTLVNVNFYYKLGLMECSEHAYNEIRARTRTICKRGSK